MAREARELDGHAHSSLGASGELGSPVVRSSDEGDDGQAQSDPTGGAGTFGAASPEWSASLAHFGGVEDGAAVLDDQPSG